MAGAVLPIDAVAHVRPARRALELLAWRSSVRLAPSLPYGWWEEPESLQSLLDEQRGVRRLAAHRAAVDVNADAFGEASG
jgi:hypothetical protein